MGLTFLFTPTAYPTTKLEIESLRGLTGVGVIVEDLPNGIKRELPFDENEIRMDVELKLRMAGIKVFSDKEYLKTPGAPFLYVVLNIGQMSNMPIFYFNIGIYVRQAVYLKRNPNIQMLGATWETSVIGAIWKDLASQIRDNIKDLLDEFINDYLSVNPKGGK